jgi:hypothetical protein
MKDAIFYFSRANIWKLSKLNVTTKNEVVMRFWLKRALNENNYVFKESKTNKQKKVVIKSSRYTVSIYGFFFHMYF